MDFPFVRPTSSTLRIVLLACLFHAIGIAQSHAYWWRDSIKSYWTDSATVPDGNDSAWSRLEEYDGPGLEFRAMNDESSLYIMISADRRDGRALLSGTFRQDITLWFLGPDSKTRTWGILFPYNTLGEPNAGALKDPKYVDEEPQVPSLEPQLIELHQSQISTLPWPADIEFHAGVSGKDPWYQIQIPLKRIISPNKRKIAFDFAVNAVDPEIKKGISKPSADSRSNEDSSDNGGFFGSGSASAGQSGFSRGRSGRSMAKRQSTQSRPEVSLPDPADLHLSLRLATKSSHHGQ